MDFLTQNGANFSLGPEPSDAPSLLTPDPVPINDMLVSPAIPSPAVSEVPSKKSERSEKSEPRRKRKYANENSRKSARAKKVKESDLFSPGDPVAGPNGQMSYTPASSSSPGDSLSDRKVAGSSGVDNVYEFTEQEEGQKPPDESLLKRKRNSRNYGKPKNRWLLETELKNINDARRRTLEPDDPAEVGTPDSQGDPDGLSESSGRQHGLPDGSGRLGLKLRICRSAQSGSYECHFVDKPEEPPPGSPQKFRTARGDCFRLGDVVWAKLVGWPWWPAQLRAFCTEQPGMAQVNWFNWDQISFVHCEKLHHFIAAFNSKLDKRRKAGSAYKLAIEQAWSLASEVKKGREAPSESYDCAADDESSCSEESVSQLPTFPAQAAPNSKLQTTPAPAPAPASTPVVAPVTAPEQSAVFQVPFSSSVEPPRRAPGPDMARPAFSTPTSSHSLPSQGFNEVAPTFNLFDSGPVGVDDAFAAFDDVGGARGVGPLPDIGPNLNLINSSNMYSFIPSFSDDDDMDTRPVLDPDSIDNIMT